MAEQSEPERLAERYEVKNVIAAKLCRALKVISRPLTFILSEQEAIRRLKQRSVIICLM
jgi:hypothetical protein